MLRPSIERRTACAVLFFGALGGCGARSMLLAGGAVGTGGQGGTGGLGGGGSTPVDASFGGGGAAPVDSGPSCPVPVRSCYTGPPGTLGVGVCKAGQQVCSGGVFGPCEGEVLPSPEICDGLDDNCNGTVDEGTCPGETCADAIATNLTTPPTGWIFNGNASWSAAGPWAELTPAIGMAAGTMIYENPIITDAFTATFSFRIGGGDGLAFMIETAGANGVGSNGGGMGVAGLGGYAVEFDTYDNGPACGDPDANHVGLDDLAGTCGMGLPVAIDSGSASVDFGDQQPHVAVVQLDSGSVSVTIDGAPEGTFAIPGWTSGKAYYYGFGAATGQAIGQQVVNSVSVQFPTYRCL
jgi:Bacterial lectin/Putative metal-binding motif